MSYPYEFALYAERNRNIVYDKVIEAIEKSGISQSQIADAIGRKRPQVSAWLSGPSNWTVDTISDLLRAVGATMEYTVVFDVDRAKSNFFHSAAEAPKQTATAVAGARGFLVQLPSSPPAINEGSGSHAPVTVE